MRRIGKSCFVSYYIATNHPRDALEDVMSVIVFYVEASVIIFVALWARVTTEWSVPSGNSASVIVTVHKAIVR